MSTFYSVQRRNFGKKDANFFAREEDRMTSVDVILILCVEVHMGLDPSPIDMRPHELVPSV